MIAARLSLLLLALLPGIALAQELNLDLEQLIARSLQEDPRIEERSKEVEAARALLDEVMGHGSTQFDVTAFMALTTEVKGGFFEASDPTRPRSDKYDWSGVSPWSSLQFSVIKPLYTFGKIEHYAAAARANIRVKKEDVRLQNGTTIYDVSRAYYGYLAADDICALFRDVVSRLDKAISLVSRWLKTGEGNVLQSDLYALQTGRAIIERYLAECESVRKVAIAGLKMLAGLDSDDQLTLKERRIRPLPLPQMDLAGLQDRALGARPEMVQLENGLRARRELVEANRAEKMPNVFAGLVGTAAYSPGRSRLDNPFIYDPFNDYAATPLVGIQWQWASGVQRAQVAKARAELEALVAKNRFAMRGIPFEVSEQYHKVESGHRVVQQMEEASRAGRRWMVSSYANFEAGVEDAEDALTAFQGYVLAHSDYLRAVNDYNMNVVRLRQVTGDY